MLGLFRRYVVGDCICLDYSTERKSDTYLDGNTLITGMLKMCNATVDGFPRTHMLEVIANVTILHTKIFVTVVSGRGLGYQLGLLRPAYIDRCRPFADHCFAQVQGILPLWMRDQLESSFKEIMESREGEIKSVRALQNTGLMIAWGIAACVSLVVLQYCLPQAIRNHLVPALENLNHRIHPIRREELNAVIIN